MASDGPKSGSSPLPVSLIIVANVLSSVALVALNKILFRTLGWPFVTLLSAAHFFSGYFFLALGSSPRFSLFQRPPASTPMSRVYALAAAGALSIVLNNYSLQLNTLGTAQIFKAAVLPVVVVFTLCQDRSRAPTLAEGLAVSLVVAGSGLSVSGDLTATAPGMLVGLLAVVITAQYQLWQGALQKRLGLSAIQLMYVSQLPQGALTLAASLFLETDWNWRLLGEKRSDVDVWTFRFTTLQLVFAAATCFSAILLNWSTFSILGRTSAVTMQVGGGGARADGDRIQQPFTSPLFRPAPPQITTQAKAVIIFTIDYVLFPRPVSVQQMLGNAVCILGALYYGILKSAAPVVAAAQPSTK
jgi:hypothetical protein